MDISCPGEYVIHTAGVPQDALNLIGNGNARYQLQWNWSSWRSENWITIDDIVKNTVIMNNIYHKDTTSYASHAWRKMAEFIQRLVGEARYTLAVLETM